MVAGSWNIFDLKIQGNIYEARENLDASNASAKSLKNAIALDVKNSYLELKSAQEVIESTQKAQELADENYSVATTRYSAGAATNLEVIDAEVSLTQARLNHLQSQFDIKIAQAKLNKVVGQEVL